MTSNNGKLRNVNYGSSRRQSLGEMIKSIYNEIPETEVSAREGLASIQDSLWYTAPEVLNTIIYKIFEFLQKTPILNTPETPQWLTNIQKIWTTAMLKDSKDIADPTPTSGGG